MAVGAGVFIGSIMRILVFQHIPVEHPGIIRDFLAEDGIPWDAVELDAGDQIPDLDGYDALVVMGGRWTSGMRTNIPGWWRRRRPFARR